MKLRQLDTHTGDAQAEPTRTAGPQQRPRLQSGVANSRKETWLDSGLSSCCLNMTWKAQATKWKTDAQDIRGHSARVSENTARKWKHRMGESNCKSHKGLVSRTHKALLQLKTATQLKMGQRSRCFSKEDKQWPISTGKDVQHGWSHGIMTHWTWVWANSRR